MTGEEYTYRMSKEEKDKRKQLKEEYIKTLIEETTFKIQDCICESEIQKELYDFYKKSFNREYLKELI